MRSLLDWDDGAKTDKGLPPPDEDNGDVAVEDGGEVDKGDEVGEEEEAERAILEDEGEGVMFMLIL